MKYITHHRYKGKSMINSQVNISYGTELETYNDLLITSDGIPICYTTSEIAKKYFAYNDDNNGLERGKLIYAIAYENRKCTNGYRFSDENINLLINKYNKFLKQNVNTILFNDNFFIAKPNELYNMAKDLNIKIKD